MGRSPCCEQDAGVKKGPWTPEEDKLLVDYIRNNGGAHGSWRRLPKLAGLNRCGKSCRLRWTNYLRPDIKRGSFTADEEKLIINLHAAVGNKWSSIATKLPGRTDNEIKNYWNTHLRKKLLNMGIDPVTHRPRTDFNLLAGIPNLLAQQPAAAWDINAIKLQADAAKFQILQGLVRVLASATAAPAAVPPAAGFDLVALLAAANGGLLGHHNASAPASLDQQTTRPAGAHMLYDGLLNLPPLTNTTTPPISVVSPDGLLDSIAGGGAGVSSSRDGRLSSPDLDHGGPSGSNNMVTASAMPPPLVAVEDRQCNNAAASPEDMSCEPTPASSPFDGMNMDDDLNVDSGFWKEILEQMSLLPNNHNYSSEI